MCIGLAGCLVVLLGVESVMPNVVAQRLSRLDRLCIEFTHEMFIVEPGRSPLDQAAWHPVGSGEQSRNRFTHRLTIIRPNALDEFLTNDPESGYAPLRQSIWQGAYISEHVERRPIPQVLGREPVTIYTVVEDSLNAGTFRWCPALQVFDLHMQDSTVTGLNVLSLLKSYDAHCIREVGSISTFVAEVAMAPGGWTVGYEFDLDEDGTPLRIRSVSRFHDGAKPAWREQYVLATTEVNGAQLPTDVVVVSHNPNVADYYAVDHITVTAWTLLDPQTRDDAVRIVAERRNSVVHTSIAGTNEQISRYYDENGVMVREIVSQTDCSGAGVVPRESLRWRRVIPAAAVTAGLLMVLGLARMRAAGT